MQYIEKSNDFILLFSFVCIVILAETSATIGVFLAARGYVITGAVFYILKIIIYIPSIDIFRRNKKRLIKYKIIQIGLFIYEKIEKNPLFSELKKKFRLLKEKILLAFKECKKKFINF